jgi:hypothetical protein
MRTSFAFTLLPLPLFPDASRFCSPYRGWTDCGFHASWKWPRRVLFRRLKEGFEAYSCVFLRDAEVSALAARPAVVAARPHAIAANALIIISLVRGSVIE